MVFNSIAFVVFFVILASVLSLTNLKKVKALTGEKTATVRQWILLIASYFFYGWWDWRFAFLVLGLTATAYFCALLNSKTKKKLYVVIGVVVPLVILGFFKYFNFFVDSFVSLFAVSRPEALKIILPLGISFYTFQSISYTIDVFRGKLAPEKSFLKIALYIAFFPQILSGPIVKAGVFLPQLDEDRNISLKNLEAGLQYFVFGLFKKIVIADHLSVGVDAVFNAPENYSGLSVLFAVIAYSIQIYCDFSGYSDMAIGSAKALGFDLPRNFNMPYISKNVTEFWKRWHISLSSWLMEYLYFSLGGNRRGKVRTYINLLLTMLLGGLWHGAAWTFVVWGALHGAALCVHKLWMKWTGHGKNYEGTLLGNLASAILTYAFVIFCWIFFKAPTFSGAFAVIRGIITWQKGIFYISSWTVVGIALVVLCTAVALIRSAKNKTKPEGFYPVANLNTVWGLTLLIVALGITLGLAYTGSNPFIYFQF
ncbi:MAG: MBOAT family protein [Clostridia bacterium]|nr:MBOAT family protein [Clostridia bacterium]